MSRVVCGDGDGDGGQAEVMTFKGSGNSAGVMDIFAHVSAMINAGNNEIGAGVEVAGHGEMDTIGRSAIHAPNIVTMFGDAKRSF